MTSGRLRLGKGLEEREGAQTEGERSQRRGREMRRPYRKTSQCLGYSVWTCLFSEERRYPTRSRVIDVSTQESSYQQYGGDGGRKDWCFRLQMRVSLMIRGIKRARGEERGTGGEKDSGSRNRGEERDFRQSKVEPQH